MSDIKLFQMKDGDAEELRAEPSPAERDLHDLVERGMERILGIKFLAREHSTGRFSRGYIDSLGLDENNCPVIVEYKRRGNENVINQALYYLDWLMDHKGDFTLLVKEKMGPEAAEAVEFGEARIICVAASFSRYDERAIRQIGKTIELVRYKFYRGGLLLLELLDNSLSLLREAAERTSGAGGESPRPPMPPELRSRLLGMADATESIYLDLLEFAENIGEDVSIKFLKHYVALNRLKNFASFQPHKGFLKLWLNLDPAMVAQADGFCRDVSQLGHHGPGSVEIELRSLDDLIRAKPFILMAYEQS